MAEEKNTITKEVKQFKEGLEKIRREEMLAEEAAAKAKLEAREIIIRGTKKTEELFRQEKNEADRESEELFKKTREEALTQAEELKTRGAKDKKELEKKAKTNLDKAIEFVVKKIME